MELERVPLHTIQVGDEVSLPTGFGNHYKKQTVITSKEILGYEWMIKCSSGFLYRTHKTTMVRRYVRKALPENDT